MNPLLPVRKKPQKANMMAITMAPRAGAPGATDGERERTARPGSKGSKAFGDTNDEGEWMRRARKLANQRAAQFRKERGAPPVAPAPWRRRRKADKGDGEDADARHAARARTTTCPAAAWRRARRR